MRDLTEYPLMVDEVLSVLKEFDIFFAERDSAGNMAPLAMQRAREFIEQNRAQFEEFLKITS